MQDQGDMLVNASRGTLIDEITLCKMLTRGKIKGAVLDVNLDR